MLEFIGGCYFRRFSITAATDRPIILHLTWLVDRSLYILLMVGRSVGRSLYILLMVSRSVNQSLGPSQIFSGYIIVSKPKNMRQTMSKM